jgi:glycosyltransferase involved in cell wall biosynthesis
VEDFNYPGTRELLELPPEQPDIVHIHNAHGGYLDLRWVSSISNSKPAILNLRDMWLLTGHCAYPLGCKRWKVGCGNCPDLSIYPSISRDATSFNWKRKLGIYKNSKLFITTPSEWLMNNVKESMLEGIEYRVIPNAIDLGIFRPGDKSEARDELTLPKDSKIILFAAHSQFKDYATVVESLNLANSNKRLLFICLGKNGEDEKLANGNLIHVGFKSDPKEVANYFRAADIFVHASKGEAFGKTIVEAMGCGVPVIATKIGGIPEIITHGVTGFLIGPRNSYQLAKKIELLLSNDVLRTSIGQAGLKHTLQNYGLQRQASSFLDWYKEILQRF